MNTTHKHQCNQCKHFFHTTNERPVTDITGHVDHYLSTCPVCGSWDIISNKDYVDVVKIRQRLDRISHHIHCLEVGLNDLNWNPKTKKAMDFIVGYLYALENTIDNDVAYKYILLKSNNAADLIARLKSYQELLENIAKPYMEDTKI